MIEEAVPPEKLPNIEPPEKPYTEEAGVMPATSERAGEREKGGKEGMFESKTSKEAKLGTPKGFDRVLRAFFVQHAPERAEKDISAILEKVSHRSGPQQWRVMLKLYDSYKVRFYCFIDFVIF